MKKGKRYLEAEKLIDSSKDYSAKEAIDTIQNYCREKDCDKCPFFSPLQDCKLKMPLEWED